MWPSRHDGYLVTGAVESELLMSVESATAFLEQMDGQPDVFSKLESCKEAVALGETIQLSFTVDEFHTAMMKRNGTLSEEALLQVSAGVGGPFGNGCIGCSP